MSDESELAKRIRQTYSQAAKEVQQKLKAFKEAHEKRAEEMLRKVADGKITEKQYKDWLQGQVFIGKRWEEKLKDITQVYVDADKKARELVGGTTKNVFVKFANSTAKDLQKGTHGAVSFDLYDRKTVERLLKKDPQMLPEWKIDQPKDYTWNYKRVKNAVAQGIIQGESVGKIGARLTAELSASNANKMNIFARTAITGAENAGRIDRLHEAQEMGISVKKKWLTAHDARVRDAHADLDGQEVDVDEPFKTMDGREIDYPGDPTADPDLVYNCRCTLVYVYKLEESTKEKTKTEETIDNGYVEENRQNEKENIEMENGQRTQEVLAMLNNSTIQSLDVNEFDSELTKDEIIERLAGGDMTKGSCASLSFAYAGNCAGFDVLDFRGGESCEMFSRPSVITNIAQMEGVQSKVTKSNNDIKAAVDLLKGIEPNKDYILATGAHAAIVRKSEKGFEYLEMQSTENSGWHKLTSDILRWRFGCKKSHTYAGFKLEKSNILIEVDSLKKNAGFKKILSYINTNKNEQSKGALGHEK